MDKKMLIWSCIAFLLVQTATAGISITNYGPSGTINTASAILTITTNGSATCKYDTSSGNYESLANTFSTTGGTSHSKNASLSSDGAKIFYARCKGADNTTAAATISFSRDTAPPVASAQSIRVGSANATITVITSENASCRYDTTDTAYASMASSLAKSGNSHTASVSGLGEGAHVYYARCRDSAGNAMTASATITVITDLSAPQVLSHTPTNKITKPYTLFNITTDENATCRYSTASGVNYDNMDGSMISDETSHSVMLTGLSDYKYHYYIKCKDEVGNIAGSDYDASFEVDSPPTAKITLSKSSPLRQGTVSIVLTTSEDVQYSPSLSYTLSTESATKIAVPLTGSDSTWTGYVLIADSVDNAIGSFTFSGMDLAGNTGTAITSGNVFIVDSIDPPAPTDVSSHVRANGNIKVKWRYEGEGISEFNIYRATVPDVDYADFYRSTDEQEYIDTSTRNGETYYYRISAVDKAGNEGVLSVETSELVSINETTAATAAPASSADVPADTASPGPKVDTKKIAGIESLIERTISESDEVPAEGNEALIADLLNLNQNNRMNQMKLAKLKEELAVIRSGEAGEARIPQIEAEIAAIRGSVATHVKMLSETAADKSLLTNEAAEEIVKSLLPGADQKNLDETTKQLMGWQERFGVETKARIFRITYLDNGTADYTLITKSYSGEFGDMELIEYIPKDVAESVDEITFREEHKIIKRDPIVRITLGDSKEIAYAVNKMAGADMISGVFSVFVRPGLKESGSSAVTGFAIMDVFSGEGSFYNIAIALGSILLAALSLYYYAAPMLKRMKKGAKKTDKTDPLKTDKMDPLQAPADAEITEVLTNGHNFINRLQFNDAMQMYHKVLANYKAVVLLDEHERESVQRGTAKLYNKLMLYLNVARASECAAKGDSEQLRSSLAGAAKIYNHLVNEMTEDERDLMVHARDIYGASSRVLGN
ncbi:MAG: hypothetical protein ABH879_04880 [archaeon]